MSPEVVLLALRLALAVVLYAFLGTTLLYLWRDQRNAGTQAELAPPAYLELVGEPSPESTYPLTALNLLGRAADNTIRLDESTVSSYHARLSFQGGQWWLEDLGSKNGTGVNELDLIEPMVVTYGDRIRLGSLQLEFKAGSQAQAMTTGLGVTAPLPDRSES